MSVNIGAFASALVIPSAELDAAGSHGTVVVLYLGCIGSVTLSNIDGLVKKYFCTVSYVSWYHWLLIYSIGTHWSFVVCT
jgi:hypothetical protein